MEVGGNMNTGSSLPPNYLSLFELRERWLQKKATEERTREKTEEKQKSEAQVQGQPKEKYGPKVNETPQTTEAQSRPSDNLHKPKKKRNKRRGNHDRTAANKVREPASKEAEAAAEEEKRKKVGGSVDWKGIDGREKKRGERRRQKTTSRSHGRTGADPESENRAAMAVPVAGRREPERGIGVYNSEIVEEKAMERKGSVNRFSEVEKKFEKLSMSVGDERGRHRSGIRHNKGGFRHGIENYGRWSYSCRSEARRQSTRHGVVWVKKGEGSSGGDGKQVNDHGFSH